MGFFSFFTREKKEALDNGLNKTKQSFLDKLSRAVAGKSKVDDDVLDNLEEVLVTSDVGVDTTLEIIERIQARVARDKYVTTSELNNLLRDEIAQLLTENNTEDTEGYQIPDGIQKPYVIMVVGRTEGLSRCGRHVPCRCRGTALYLGRACGRTRSEAADGQRPGQCGLRCAEQCQGT